MIESKYFAKGCLVILIILLCIALIPILFVFFKLSLFLAIPVAIVVGLIFGIAMLGKVVRWIFSKKPQP